MKTYEAAKKQFIVNYHRALLTVWGAAKAARRVARIVVRISTDVIEYVEARREGDCDGK